MGEVYTRFQTKTAQEPYSLGTWTGLYNAGLQPMASGWLVGNLNSDIKVSVSAFLSRLKLPFPFKRMPRRLTLKRSKTELSDKML